MREESWEASEARSSLSVVVGNNNGELPCSGSSPCRLLNAFLMSEARCERDNERWSGSIVASTGSLVGTGCGF